MEYESVVVGTYLKMKNNLNVGEIVPLNIWLNSAKIMKLPILYINLWK